MSRANTERGHSSPIRSIASRNSWRSSALAMAGALAPIISMPCAASTPFSSRSSAVLSAVCPPIVGSSAKTRPVRDVRLFPDDDLFDEVRRDRLDIGRVRQPRIGHDRRGVGIDQHDPVALGLQRLAGLRARIVEFAGLTDDDGSGADDQNAVDIVPPRHQPIPVMARARRAPSPAGAIAAPNEACSRPSTPCAAQ